jgi:hypothetical protein
MFANPNSCRGSRTGIGIGSLITAKISRKGSCV